MKFTLGSENERNKTKEMNYYNIIYHYILMYFLLFIPPSLGAKYEF